jgi:hypothetical protein
MRAGARVIERPVLGCARELDDVDVALRTTLIVARDDRVIWPDTSSTNDVADVGSAMRTNAVANARHGPSRLCCRTLPVPALVERRDRPWRSSS